jgi:hypothetical protein
MGNHSHASLGTPAWSLEPVVLPKQPPAPLLYTLNVHRSYRAERAPMTQPASRLQWLKARPVAVAFLVMV